MLGGVTGPAAPPNVHSSQTRAPRDDLAVLRNRTFTELTVGESAGLERTLTPQDIQLFAIESGDVNPAHLDPEFAASTRFHGVVAHGMWGAALISAVLGTRLPGPGTIYLGQTLNFRAPVRIGDTLEVRVTVREKDEQTHRVRLDCTATRQDGTAVIDGEALVLAPTERIELPRTTLPQVRLEPDGEHGVQKLLAQAAQAATASEPVRAAIVHPCDTASLDAVIAARDLRLLTPVVLAPRHKLDAIAQEAGLDLEGLEIIDVPHSHAAAAQAARLAASGAVAAPALPATSSVNVNSTRWPLTRAVATGAPAPSRTANEAPSTGSSSRGSETLKVSRGRAVAGAAHVTSTRTYPSAAAWTASIALTTPDSARPPASPPGDRTGSGATGATGAGEPGRVTGATGADEAAGAPASPMTPAIPTTAARVETDSGMSGPAFRSPGAARPPAVARRDGRAAAARYRLSPDSGRRCREH